MIKLAATTSAGTKDVYIVDAHHEVLEAWAEVRGRLTNAPVLVTFDHHTDLHAAFIRDLCRGMRHGDVPDPADVEKHAAAQSALIDFMDHASVRSAILKLSNDEHIDAAHRSDIVSHVFVSLGTDSCWGIKRPWSTVMGYDPCVPGCPRRPHTDRCTRPKADRVVEDDVLGERVETIRRTIESFDHREFILDFDLDVFRTQKAIEPDTSNCIADLVRTATAITIAREPVYVRNGRLWREKITADSLQQDLLKLIQHC